MSWATEAAAQKCIKIKMTLVLLMFKEKKVFRLEKK
jgi:hypothetical protein